MHDVVVPSYNKPVEATIFIEGLSRKGCHKTKEHLNKLESYQSYVKLDPHDLIENKTNEIKVKLNSLLPDVPKMKDVFSFGDKYRSKYHYYLHSCAYYSITDHPTFTINAYPDVVWIAHFQYNYTHTTKGVEAKTPYYFHNKKLELKNGIEQEIKEISQSIIGDILRLFPSGWLTQNVLWPYMQKEAEIYDVGLHAIYDRKIEKIGIPLSLEGKELDFIKTDNVTRYIVAYVIYQMVAVGIVIDLLMLYLTRGRSAQGKLAKIAKKIKKVSKYLDDAGAELVPPSIAINTGMYYKMLEDKRVALIVEANIKADPLVAINFEKKFNLADLIKEKSAKESNQKKKDKIENVLKKIGGNIIITLKIFGEINIEQNVQYNVLTEQYSLKDMFSELIQNNSTTYSRKINGTVLLEGNISKKLFEFSPLELQVDAKIKFEMDCEAVIITQFGYDKKEGKGLYMEQKLKFSGLKGTFTGNIKGRNDIFGEYEYSSNNNDPIDFILLEGKTITLNKIYFFNSKPQK